MGTSDREVCLVGWKRYLGLPKNVSTALDRDSIRQSMKSGAVKRHNTGCHWVTMMQTEAASPVTVLPGRCAVSFMIMPSVDTELEVNDGAPPTSAALASAAAT
jgi:hypothetical protein